jgi:hypothetical protein
MASLTKGASVLALPDNGLWPDEFDWRPVVERAEPSAAGALLRDLGTMLAGRPVTLQFWLPKSSVMVLYGWAADATAQLVLSWAGQTMPVVFDHTKSAFTAQPLHPWATYLPSDLYRVTLSLKTVV